MAASFRVRRTSSVPAVRAASTSAATPRSLAKATQPKRRRSSAAAWSGRGSVGGSSSSSGKATTSAPSSSRRKHSAWARSRGRGSRTARPRRSRPPLRHRNARRRGKRGVHAPRGRAAPWPANGPGPGPRLAGPRRSARSTSLPSGAPTSPAPTAPSPSHSAWAARGTVQPPSSVSRKPRSASTQMRVRRCSTASNCARSGDSVRHSSASAPCPTAGSMTSTGRTSVTSRSRPSRRRPARARMDAGEAQLGGLPQPGAHVPAERHHLHVGPGGPELTGPAQRRGPHPSTAGERREAERRPGSPMRRGGPPAPAPRPAPARRERRWSRPSGCAPRGRPVRRAAPTPAP